MIVDMLFAIVIHQNLSNYNMELSNILSDMNYDFNTEQQIELTEQEMNCLALNIYHESRGESITGQMAVAEVTLNRTQDERYPDDVCSVVWQENQFSWTSDNASDKPKDKKSWQRAQRIARIISQKYNSSVNITNGAIMFHAIGSKPTWRKKFERTIQIGGHVFYR